MEGLLTPSSICIILAIAVTSILITHIALKVVARKKYGKRKYHQIGGTVLNQLLNFERLHDYMTDLAATYKTYRLISPFRNEIYSSDPEIAEYILKTNFHNYGKGWYNYKNLRDLLGDGIFAVDGEKWRTQRKVSSYEFSTRVLRDFSSVIFRENAVKLANLVAEAARHNRIIDMQDLFMKSTLDSIFKVAFGVELDSVCGTNEEGIRFCRAFDDASALTLFRYVDIFWPIKKFLNIGSEAKLKRSIEIVDDFVYKLIQNKIQQIRHISQSNNDNDTKKDDILSRFLQLDNETDPKYLRDIILNFIIAGKDTTATALSWFVYMMCKHPQVQEKVVKEIKNTTKAEQITSHLEFAAKNLSEECLDKMHYLHAALTETLRLYPSVPVMSSSQPVASNEVLAIGVGDDSSTNPKTNDMLDEGDSAEPSKKRKTMKARADVWSHYTKYTQNGEQRCKCNYCPQTYKHEPSLHGTSTLRYHMKRCEKGPMNSKRNHSIDSKQTTLNVMPKFGLDGSTCTISKWTFKYDHARKALAYMIVVDELPFKFVENKGFRYFVSSLTDKFNVPSRVTVSRDCFELYVEEGLKLKKFLKSNCRRVCLTTDTWTSLQQINYMCLTAHFIDDDWKLNKRILNFCPITSHKGDVVGKAIEKCLLNWGLDNVMTITVDNASSNDTAIKYLKKKLKEKQVILNGEALHVRCVAHIMNLVVQDGLKLVDKSIRRVRNAVKYVKQSPRRLELFKKCVEEEKIEHGGLLSLDVPTRWNSTYLMLDTALKFQSAFDRFNDIDPFFNKDLKELLDREIGETRDDEDEWDDGSGKPIDDDWVKVKDLSLMLKSFYDLTVRVSGSSYVTANRAFVEIFNVDCRLNVYCGGSDFRLSTMAEKMKEKCNKYWGNPEKINVMIFVAAVIDPRNKMKFVNFGIEKMYREKAVIVKKNVEIALYRLFDEYKSSSMNVGESSSEARNLSCSNIDNAVMLEDDFSRMLYNQEMAFDVGDKKSELDKYLADDCEPYQPSFDVLSWWKANGHKYPILSLLARDVLAIPISTVASESAFSTGGRVLDSFRSSLSPKVVEALICTQDWLRASDLPIEVEEHLDSVERLEKDIANIKLAPPVIDVL